jgi:hypothetical protein
MAVRRRPRTKFYFVLGATAVVIAVILVLLLGSPHTVAVEWSSAEFDNSYDMLIVRDEVVYEAKNYGKTNYIASHRRGIRMGLQ